MTQKNFRLMFTVYFIVFGVAIAVFGSFIGYSIQMVNISKQIHSNAEEIAFDKRTYSLKPNIERMESLVVALASNKATKNYIATQSEEKRADLANLFFAVAHSDKLIMQVRYIDANGIEKVRVDRTNENCLPFEVERSKLQNKSGRDYFQIVSKMSESTIWHSKLDLNIENGKIEVPYRPTIRIAMPIFDHAKFSGMLIINMLTNELINGIKSSTVFDHYIVDKDGNYIVHPNDKYSFNKYTNTSRSLTNDFSEDAFKILAGNYDGDDFYAYKLDDILQNDDKAILILKPKEQYRSSLFNTNIQAAFIVIILSILVSIPLALYASMTPSKLQKALALSNDELKRFSEIIDKYVITVTTKTNSVITAVSSAFEKISGYNKSELVGTKLTSIEICDDNQDVCELLNFKEIDKELKREIKNKTKDGSEFWLDQTIIPIKDASGNIDTGMLIGIDITAKKELEHLSSIDKLTGVANRRRLDEVLVGEVYKAQRHKKPLSLLIVDIDHFKHVNDTFGHQVGDCTLKTVANLIQQNLRKSDFIGRFGGEEFVIICPETNLQSSAILAEKIRNIVYECELQEVGHKTVSIGAAEFCSDDTLEQLISKADKALYVAKNSGRNRVEEYHDN